MAKLTSKQVAALNRRFDRNGESPLKVGQCRMVNNRRVKICRYADGHEVVTSPHTRGRAKKASRSQRLSPYYNDYNLSGARKRRR